MNPLHRHKVISVGYQVKENLKSRCWNLVGEKKLRKCGPKIDFATVCEAYVRFFGFWFLVCYTATPLTLSLHQERIQVVRSNGVVHRIPAQRHSRNRPWKLKCFFDWWLLLLLETVIEYPCLRVYVPQIHADLSSRFLSFAGFEPTTSGLKVPRSDQLS